jgi:hypothetical protein
MQGYHTLVPLESIGGDRRKFGNWYSTVYRATNESTGVPHALRRIEGEFPLIEWVGRYIDGFCHRLSAYASNCIHCHRDMEPNTPAEHCLRSRSIHYPSFQ